MPTARRIGLSFDQFSFVRMCRSIAGLCRIGVLTLTIQARFYTNQWLVAKRQQALAETGVLRSNLVTVMSSFWTMRIITNVYAQSAAPRRIQPAGLYGTLRHHRAYTGSQTRSIAVYP